MESIEIINNLKQENKRFSLHTIKNKYEVDENKIKEILGILLKDKSLFIYCFISCPHCNSKNYEDEYSKEMIQKKRKCYFCKKDFTSNMENVQFVFDPQTLMQRYKRS